MSKTIAKVWTFPSSSDPTKNYETLQYDDGSTSCNCKGWINGGKRLDANGNRTCRHTRLVDQGRADAEALSSKDYGSGNTTKVATKKKTYIDPMDKELKNLDKVYESKRKISWK